MLAIGRHARRRMVVVAGVVVAVIAVLAARARRMIRVTRVGVLVRMPSCLVGSVNPVGAAVVVRGCVVVVTPRAAGIGVLMPTTRTRRHRARVSAVIVVVVVVVIVVIVVGGRTGIGLVSAVIPVGAAVVVRGCVVVVTPRAAVGVTMLPASTARRGWRSSRRGWRRCSRGRRLGRVGPAVEVTVVRIGESARAARVGLASPTSVRPCRFRGQRI